MTKQPIFTTLLLTLLLSVLAACNAPASNKAQAPENSSTSQPTEAAQRRQMVRQQIDVVLTPEQKQELQTKMQQGTKMRKALASMDLTDDQRAKIQAIFKAAHAQKQTTNPQ
jgi:Spy/CpxP family protein refolding chaperone